MNKIVEINKILFRKNSYYFSTFKKIDATQEFFNTISGHKEKKRSKFAQRPDVGKLKWFNDHILEIYTLIRQIGILHTLRFLRYASSPKILYVDFVIVNNGDDKIVYKSETSIPLQDRYTYNDIENFKMKEILIHDVEIKNSVSFEIKKIKSNSKSFNIKKNDTNIYMLNIIAGLLLEQVILLPQCIFPLYSYLDQKLKVFVLQTELVQKS